MPVSEYGAYLEKEQGPWVDERNRSAKYNFSPITFNREEEEAKRPEDDDEAKEDFSALKDALSGLKLGGSIGSGKPQQNQIESHNNITADTPLNTQIDGVT